MKKILALFFFLLFIPFAGAVEIQLESGRNADNKPEMNVGYVDVNALFEEHPLTARLKEEFMKEVDKRKQMEKDEHVKLVFFEGVLLSSATEVRQLRQDIENLKKNQNQPQILPQNQNQYLSSSLDYAVLVLLLLLQLSRLDD